MARKMYIGVDSKARKVKQMYVGVESKARRVKKAYIGIGGVARPFWGDYEISYYGKITALSTARQILGATSVGNYAIFAGGESTSSGLTVVDAYNTELTRSKPTALTVGRGRMGATTVGDYAIFAGGTTNTGSSGGRSDVVDAYNSSLTRSTPEVLSSARYSPSATTVGDYAIFFGGQTGSYNVSASVEAYNTSLTRTLLTQSTRSRVGMGSASIGNYALFVGGHYYGSSYNSLRTTIVEAYDTSLTQTILSDTSEAMSGLRGTTLGDYAVLGGGRYGSYGGVGNPTLKLQVYNKSLTLSTPVSLSSTMVNHTAVTLKDNAIFASAYIENDSNVSSLTNVFDKNLTRTIQTKLATKRTNHASTTIGNYALFAGGNSNPSDSSKGYVAVVEAYVAQ